MTQALLLALLALSVGCARLSAWAPGGTPTLTATFVDAVPKVTGTYVTNLWEPAKPLVVRARRGGLVCPVWMKAIHDGQTLAIFLLWFDATDSLDRRQWAWNDAARRYQLETFPVDQAAIEWPLQGSARACMLSGQDAVWDVWTWRAGWTDLAGIAEDARMTMTALPQNTAPTSVTGHLYPAPHGKGRIEIRYEPVEGDPGVIELPRPEAFQGRHAPGAGPGDASGHAGQVGARGLYQQYQPGTKHGYWFDSEKGSLITQKGQERGFWMVEFRRSLKTDDPAHYAELDIKRSAELALAIWDNASGADHYTTDPIRLVFEKPAKR